MSAQSSWMRCLNTCVRYLRSTRSAWGREFKRTIGRSAYNNIWNNTKGKIENVKAMRRNAFINDAPVRRYDDKYIKSHEPKMVSKSFKKVQMPRYRASDHNVRTDGTYERYLRTPEAERPRSNVPDMSDDDRDDGSFDPRFNDRHYRTYRKSTETMSHENDNTTKYEWMESENNDDANWHSWQISPRQQEQQEEPVAEDERHAEVQPTKSMPVKINAERLYGQWQTRSEPDRTIRLPSAGKPGTTYKFNKIQKENTGKYVRKPSDEDAKEQDHKYVKPNYNKYEAKVRKDHEKQFWHRWETCPDERRIYREKIDDEVTSEAVDETDLDDYDVSRRKGTKGYRYDDSHKGLIRPPSNFSGTKRKYQTSSQQATLSASKSGIALSPPRQPIEVRAKLKRKLSGMDKQFQKVWDFDRKDKQKKLLEYDVAYRRSPIFVKATPTKTESVTRLCESDSTHCIQCSLINTQTLAKRLPTLPPIRNNRATEEVEEHAQQTINHKAAAQRPSHSRLVPPRIRVTTKVSQRRTVPIPSFSECYSIDPEEVQQTEYTGFGRDTVCDRWMKFTRTPISKLF